jgi:ribonuclease HII
MIQACRITQLDAKIKKNQFELTSWSHNGLICGIDEVGRGCLAGPLVTAAIILHPNINTRNLKDSKLMTPKERLETSIWLQKRCWYGIGIVHNRLIDKHNIWNATLLAMKRALVNALAACPHCPDAILVDAMPLELFDTGYPDIPVHYFPKGEKYSSSIAAASIIAKVKRDALMCRLDEVFPGYKLSEHKGYGTPDHREILSKTPCSIIHRRSFLNNIDTYHPKKDESHGQQTLF